MTKAKSFSVEILVKLRKFKQKNWRRLVFPPPGSATIGARRGGGQGGGDRGKGAQGSGEAHANKRSRCARRGAVAPSPESEE